MKINKIKANLGYHCGLVHCHKYETDYIFENGDKRLSLRKDTAMCEF